MRAHPHLDPALRGIRADEVLAALLDAQHRVAARAQLLQPGVSRRVIDRWLQGRRLAVMHRGVLGEGGPPWRPLSRAMAAALAGGDGAAIGGAAATWLWSLAQTLPQTIDVHAPTRRRTRPGLRFHSARPTDEVTVHEGIPVVIPPRALLDVARYTPIHRLERMFNLAEERHLAANLSLSEILDRYPGRPGTPKLHKILSRHQVEGTRRLRSDGEAALLAFCDSHGLPRPPHTNYILELGDARYELDGYWPEHRLGLEFDSWEFHGDRASFRTDRIRDRRLTRAGIRIVRVTDYDLGEGAAPFARDMRDLLGV